MIEFAQNLQGLPIAQWEAFFVECMSGYARKVYQEQAFHRNVARRSKSARMISLVAYMCLYELFYGRQHVPRVALFLTRLDRPRVLVKHRR